MNDIDFSPITTFIFDFDGVMTDGTVFCDFDGHPLPRSLASRVIYLGANLRFFAE